MSLNGVEKTFTEPTLAGMLDMRKGPLYEMLGQATQQQLAQPRTTTTPPIWQGRGLRGDPVSVLSRNPDGTFQTLIHGQEKTRTERDIAQMLNLRKAPLHEMLGQATQKQRHQAHPENSEMLESRWAPKPLPKGVSSEAVQEWKDYLKRKRVQNPVQARDIVEWEGGYGSLRNEVERAMQGMLDLIPRDIIERVGKVKVVMQTTSDAVMGRYDAETNSILINYTELAKWKDVDAKRAEKGLPGQPLVTPLLRDTMWHEMTHWLHVNARAHPRLARWRRNLEEHWQHRTRGEQIRVHKQGWKFIRDGWLSDYVGRWYPGWGWGTELPSVYLEEVSKGPENIAYWCKNDHQIVTFKIVTSIFGNL